MDPAVSIESSEFGLDEFVEFLYGGSTGYVYLAALHPQDKKKEEWLQEFFAYPQDADKLKTAIRTATKTHEVYIAPAIFQKIDGKIRGEKEFIKETNVVWTEFDGNASDFGDFDAKPSLTIQSSLESHTHVYWKLASPLRTPAEIEAITHRITYNFAADGSAWDANQVLRPPETFNHKRGLDVIVRAHSQVSYDAGIFDSLNEAPPPIAVTQWAIGSLPEAQDVILRYAFTEDLVQLLKKDLPEGKRSSGLMQLGFGCCALGMSDVEVFVILRLADDRWGKFKHRRDRDQRLADIVSVARNKYPDQTDTVPEQTQFAYGYKTFMALDIEVNWVIEEMLLDLGNMLFTGPGGVGKTQFTLEIMKHMALGKDFLHYKIPEAKKIVFLSLEMGGPPLQMFMESQDKVLTADERDQLQENLVVIPVGENWPLNTPLGQDRLRSVLDVVQPDGLFVDSVGKAVLGNISNPEQMQPFLNFNDKIIKEYEMFLWYIHHNRKKGQGSTGPVGGDDVYGDQYLFNSCSSNYMLLKHKSGNLVVRNPKNRMAIEEGDYFIKRDPDTLTFSEVNAGITKVIEALGDEDEDNPTAGGMGQFGL